MWVALFIYMRGGDKKSDRKRGLVGKLLIGPLHPYMAKRGYSLTKRELLGWGLVLVLMLAAPLITSLLE